jgi:hypothetical protein
MRSTLRVICIATLATLVLGGCGSNTDPAARQSKAAKPADTPETSTNERATAPAATNITLRIMSGRQQPPPESWTARVGQEVVFTIEGIGPPKVGIVGPGLGEDTDSTYGLTNLTADGLTVNPQLRFTPTEPGTFYVSEVDGSLPLGTLTVTE